MLTSMSNLFNLFNLTWPGLAPHSYENDQTSCAQSSNILRIKTCCTLLKPRNLLFLHISILVIRLQTLWVRHCGTWNNILSTDNLLHCNFNLLTINRPRNLVNLEDEGWHMSRTQFRPDLLYNQILDLARELLSIA
jgi:hypothetical protein